jgi:Tfp pilus assembly protein FimT
VDESELRLHPCKEEIMRSRCQRPEAGFTVVETAVVVAVAAVVIAFAAPRMTNAMKEFRLQSATQMMADMVARAKMQGLVNNATSSLTVDTVNNLLGFTTFDPATNKANGTTWVPLPQGITFGRPQGSGAPMTGAPTASSISFAAQDGSTSMFQQDFTSKGFPNVTAGTVHAVYLTNGKSYSAITLTSVGGVRLWRWDGSNWYSGHRTSTSTTSGSPSGQ